MNIGVGVCSYKRPVLAMDTCKSILATVDKIKYNISTVCSVDDTDIDGYEWVYKNFGLIYGVNKGIAYNKNRLIKYLYGNDVIFLTEDDILFIKKGWIDLYLKAINLTGFQHFNYIVSDYRKFIKNVIKYGDITLGNSGPYVNGVLMVMSSSCIDRVGGFDDRYGRYGYEHADYTNRCKKAGLCPSFHVHVMEASPYIEWTPSRSSIPEEEKKACIQENSKLFNAPVKNIYNPSYKDAMFFVV
jgi:GT2 family glycosyltransferase